MVIFKMTQKAAEDRTTMKVPVSFRELVRQRAKDCDMTMMDYLVETIEGRSANLRQNGSKPSTAGTQTEAAL
jgi:hypothetical protein